MFALNKIFFYSPIALITLLGIYAFVLSHQPLGDTPVHQEPTLKSDILVVEETTPTVDISQEQETQPAPKYPHSVVFENPVVEKQLEYGEVVKNLGYGVTVQQDDDNTYVLFKSNILFTQLNDISSIDDISVKNAGFETLNKIQQLMFIKKTLSDKYKISHINQHYIVLEEWLWDSTYTYLLDTKKGDIQEIHICNFIQKSEVGGSGIYIMGNGCRAGSGGLDLITGEGNQINLFENNADAGGELPYFSGYQKIQDFELLINKQVKVIYEDQNGETQETIINI